MTVYFRGGSYLDPAGMEGLADLTAELWPASGAGDRSARQLDDELDRLAADVTAEIGDTSGSLALDVLARHIEPAAMHALLDRTLGTLAQSGPELPAVPQPAVSGAPGLWVLDRPEMVQARVRIGQLGLRMDDSDELPLLAWSEVLGGGFSSRLVRKLRSQEGLAYDVYSGFSFPAAFPGTFATSFQTKSSSCVFGASIVLRTIHDLLSEEISPQELSTAKSSLLARAIEQLGSSSATVATLAQDEQDGRSSSYWPSFGDRVASLSAATLRAAAARHLDPGKLIILVIGNRAAIEAGSLQHPGTLDDLAPVHTLPKRDPVTLEPLSAIPES